MEISKLMGWEVTVGSIMVASKSTPKSRKSSQGARVLWGRWVRLESAPTLPGYSPDYAWPQCPQKDTATEAWKSHCRYPTSLSVTCSTNPLDLGLSPLRPTSDFSVTCTRAHADTHCGFHLDP